MSRIMKRFILLTILSCLCFSQLVYAKESSALSGYWLTRKDDTHLPSSVIQLHVDDDGSLYGQVIVGFYEVNAPLPDRVCSRCSARTVDGRYGVAHNQEIVGSYAVWGFKKRNTNTWVNGNLIRIKTGQRYRANMTLRSPDKLDVRAYYGVFYKTLRWERLPRTQVEDVCRGDISSVTVDVNVRSFCVPPKK